jgi:hypothetical protein
MNEMDSTTYLPKCDRCGKNVEKTRVLRGRLKREMDAWFVCYSCYWAFLKARKAAEKISADEMPADGPVRWFNIF